VQHFPLDKNFWPALAGQAQRWLERSQLPARDAIVLLPFLELLPLARGGFAAQGGWQPRIETTQTLAAALAPAAMAGSGQISFDITTDRLSAAALLRGLKWGAAWARRDARGFEQAVAAVADTGRSLAQAAAAVLPAQREAWWSAARALLVLVAGPGATERLLARVALEWAASAEAPATDALFSLRPSAWIVVRAGGPDALADALREHATVPTLLLDADDSLAPAVSAPRRVLCAGFEAEAQAAAAAVLHALNAGHAPVGLVAQDRLLVRRVRALLERSAVSMLDETGWKLSTTRAAARVMTLLRAGASLATQDARLDWLKGDALARHEPKAVAALEARWRQPSSNTVNEQAQALWQHAAARLQPLAEAPRQPLAAWLELLRHALRADGNGALFDDDHAGRQVLAVLRLDGMPAGDAWRGAAQASMFDFEGFSAWVDDTLEQADFVPVPPPGPQAEVIVTPPARAVLRPLGALVFPGTDEKRLGASHSPHALLPDAVVRALGLPDGEARRQREALVLRQLLRVPNAVLLRRASDGNESLAASALVERESLAAKRAGSPWPDEEPAAAQMRSVAPTPQHRPAPAAADALPNRLSASAVEALRACPYRFFARSVLRLRELPELDADLEKRDYGSWLHAVLLQFHRTRPAPQLHADEVARLHEVADRIQADEGLDAAQLLPYRAGFATLAPLYITWLHERDAAGAVFVDGEVALRIEPEPLEGVALEGRLDRIDRDRAGLQLIDYKTGSAEALKRQVREPLEDTQLAFYAALVGGVQPVQAFYLALDDRKPPQPVPHAEVELSGRQLIDGLSRDLEHLRAGAGLPALGEGRICETCEARGLCRRDHWADVA
jgi:ATP-dependent helicase/nuclease subunit B